MSKVKKNELGKGIAALLGNLEAEVNKSPEAAKEVVKELAGSIAMLDINTIEPNNDQPRKDFDEKLLSELANSIGVHGIIQPITVRRLAPNQYQIISGERRFRASKLAGLTEIPAYVRLADDQQMHEMALIENIQRADLNPIEIAATYARLLSEFKMTQEQLAERISKGRSTIANMLTLLKLPDEIQVALKNGKISTGHAKILVGIDDFSMRSVLFARIVDENLSVREAEDIRHAFEEQRAKKKAKAAPSVPDAYKPVQDMLRSFFGSKVQFKRKPDGTGNIVVNFKSDDDLNRILDIIEKSSENVGI